MKRSARVLQNFFKPKNVWWNVLNLVSLCGITYSIGHKEYVIGMVSAVVNGATNYIVGMNDGEEIFSER